MPDLSTGYRGRGCAKGVKQWGTRTMLEVVFDDKFLPLNENGSKLKQRNGLIVRNPHRVPLTYLDWRAEPIDIKDVIWREIQVKAKMNSLSRGRHGPAHRTGQKHFSQIRHEMKAAGHVMDKMSIFIKTRDPNDSDVKDFVV
ncbi:hypothetical protein RHMOL_Rhmol10G0218500 [Rhododendron molle]|uniref:Uncharacterized protein n=1 Tax=Rhododendron molle TaxID=49168 RepID=A0ACC0M5X0_RHOML|nr:hypothetical protein RHMOL_Rhmol10G0218500 [Rhododendron molle]